MDRKNHIYRKKLREGMGLDEGKIIPIVARTVTFQGFPSQQGYATQYDFNQAFLICVGCEMLSLGLALRYVDMTLTRLSGLTDVKFYKAIREQKLVLILIPSVREALEREAVRSGGRIPFSSIASHLALDSIADQIGGKSAVTNQEIWFDSGKEFRDKRISPLTLLIEEEGTKTLHDETLKGVIKSFITIELYSVVKQLDKLFK